MKDSNDFPQHKLFEIPYYPAFLIFPFRYYPCVIDEILEDGTCSVNFEGYNQSEVTQVKNIVWPVY